MQRSFTIVLVPVVSPFSESACSGNVGAQPILFCVTDVGYLRPIAARDFRAYDFLQDSVAFLDDGTLDVLVLLQERYGLSRRGGSS